MINKIKKILLPTDFGELGNFAFTLASFSAEQSETIIDVVSIVSGPSGTFYSNAGDVTNDEGEDYNELSVSLDEAKEKMESWVHDKNYIANTYCAIGEVDISIYLDMHFQ